MGNVLLAVQALSALLDHAAQINALIEEAQTSGKDIDATQLAGLVDNYNAAVTQLNADIAAAKAAGK